MDNCWLPLALYDIFRHHPVFIYIISNLKYCVTPPFDLNVNTEIKTIYLHSFHSNPIRDIFGGKTRRKGMEWGKEFNGTTRNFAI